MRVLLTISWREVREGFPRFILTLFSVALGVMFLTGTLALRDTLESTFNDIVGVNAKADLYVVGERISEEFTSTTRTSIPVAYETKIRSALGPSALLEPNIVTTQAALLDRDGNRISVGGAPTILKPAYNDRRWGALGQGRWPEGPREILLDSKILAATGYRVGDRVDIIAQSAKRSVTITGELTDLPTAFGTVPIFMERRVVEPMAIPDKKVSHIGVYLPDGLNRAEAMGAMAKALPADALIMTKERFTEEKYQAIEAGLGFVSIFLLVFVFISIFIGSFVIANTFAMIVRQRMKQFAMMRAIGAKPVSIFILVIIQALVVGIIGSVLGIGLGWVMLGLIDVLFAYLGAALSPPVMSTQVMVIGLTAGLVVTIAGAMLSARRAALTDPLEVLRESQGVPTTVLTWRSWLGMALLVAGVGACALGVHQEDATQVGIGAVFILFGVLGTQTLLTKPIMTPIGRLLARIWPVQARIALGNTLRNPARTASTAGALIIGVALVVTGASISTSLKGASTELVRNFLKSDLVVYSDSGNIIPKGEIDKVDGVDGIDQSDKLFLGFVTIEHNQEQFSNLVLFVSDRVAEYRSQTLVDGDEDALAKDEVVVNDIYVDTKDWRVGDEIVLTAPFGRKKTRVGAIVHAPVLFSPIIATERFVPDLLGTAVSPAGVDIKVSSTANVLDVQRDINNQFLEFASYGAYTPDEIEGEGNARIDTILAILYGLLALSVITAVVGVVNTLMLSVMERVREIGMVRAIGMSRQGVMGMVTIESVLLSIFGTLLGLLVGLGLSWSLIQTLASVGINAFIVPWATVGWLVVGAVVIGIVAAVFPAYRAAQINELEAMAE